MSHEWNSCRCDPCRCSQPSSRSWTSCKALELKRRTSTEHTKTKRCQSRNQLCVSMDRTQLLIQFLNLQTPLRHRNHLHIHLHLKHKLNQCLRHKRQMQCKLRSRSRSNNRDNRYKVGMHITTYKCKTTKWTQTTDNTLIRMKNLLSNTFRNFVSNAIDIFTL